MPTLKHLGIRHRPPCNTRHTYATMMLMAGMTPAFCAGQMGHSVDVFLRTYAKWLPGAGDKVEMAKLERNLSIERLVEALHEGGEPSLITACFKARHQIRAGKRSFFT